MTRNTKKEKRHKAPPQKKKKKNPPQKHQKKESFAPFSKRGKLGVFFDGRHKAAYHGGKEKKIIFQYGRSARKRKTLLLGKGGGGEVCSSYWRAL